MKKVAFVKFKGKSKTIIVDIDNYFCGEKCQYLDKADLKCKLSKEYGIDKYYSIIVTKDEYYIRCDKCRKEFGEIEQIKYEWKRSRPALCFKDEKVRNETSNILKDIGFHICGGTSLDVLVETFEDMYISIPNENKYEILRMLEFFVKKSKKLFYDKKTNLKTKFYSCIQCGNMYINVIKFGEIQKAICKNCGNEVSIENKYDDREVLSHYDGIPVNLRLIQEWNKKNKRKIKFEWE
jgi:hypothetical protein